MALIRRAQGEGTTHPGCTYPVQCNTLCLCRHWHWYIAEPCHPDGDNPIIDRQSLYNMYRYHQFIVGESILIKPWTSRLMTHITSYVCPDGGLILQAMEYFHHRIMHSHDQRLAYYKFQNSPGICNHWISHMRTFGDGLYVYFLNIIGLSKPSRGQHRTYSQLFLILHQLVHIIQ